MLRWSIFSDRRIRLYWQWYLSHWYWRRSRLYSNMEYHNDSLRRYSSSVNYLLVNYRYNIFVVGVLDWKEMIYFSSGFIHATALMIWRSSWSDSSFEWRFFRDSKSKEETKYLSIWSSIIHIGRVRFFLSFKDDTECLFPWIRNDREKSYCTFRRIIISTKHSFAWDSW